ncbi:MAG: hypothetical protein IJC50_03215 [Clostridia bacterium]|nr:hypothetical protein [Clostridia bacterium]
MKKIIALLLVAVFACSLCACGSGSAFMNELQSEIGNEIGNANTSENNDYPDNAVTLSVGTPVSVSDYADLTLFKVWTTKKITASLGGGIYYENSTDGETYIDVIIDLTNTSAAAVSSEDLLKAYAVGTDGTEYTRCLYAVETNNASYVSQYENIQPLSKVRFHCGISIPESESNVTVVLEIKDKKYSFGYTLGTVNANSTPISAGQTVEAADFATMVFNGIEYTDDLMPSNTSGFYTHYPIDDPANTYLIVKFDITNYQSSDRECDTFVGVKATYMDKYTYTGSVVVEDGDGEGFSAYEDIAPLSTRHFYYMITVPKSVTSNPVSLTVSFNGQEYTYTA